MMNDGQLIAFRTRMMKASLKGRGVASVDKYMTMLADEGASEDPPKGHAAGSAGHLMAMADEVLAARKSGKKLKKKAKPKAKAKPATPPPPPTPAPEEETEADERLWPDDWTKEEVYDLAQKYDIPGRSKMDKDELVAAVEKHEDEHPDEV